MKIAKSYMTRTSIGLLATTLLVFVCGTTVATAQSVTIALSIKNHRFQPAEINAPANKQIILRIKNLDATPMEFESISLRVRENYWRQ